MIRLYDSDMQIDIPNNTDLDEVLEVMDKIDESYKNRKELPSEFVNVHKDILFYAVLYVLEKDENEIKIIKNAIKFWEKFSSEQQSLILEKLVKNISNTNFIDDQIREWVYSMANIQKRYL